MCECVCARAQVRHRHYAYPHYLRLEGEEREIAVAGCKIVDLTPFVVPYRHFHGLKLLRQVEIEKTEATKPHVLGRLNDGRGGCIEESVAVDTLPRTILLARNNALAVFAVADKDLHTHTREERPRQKSIRWARL